MLSEGHTRIFKETRNKKKSKKSINPIICVINVSNYEFVVKNNV